MQANVLAQYSQAAESQCNADKIKVKTTSTKKTYSRYQKEFAEFCHVVHGDDREALEMTMEKVYGFLFYHAYHPAYPNHGGEKGKKRKGDEADLDRPLVVNMDNNTTEGITTTAITDSTATEGDTTNLAPTEGQATSPPPPEVTEIANQPHPCKYFDVELFRTVLDRTIANRATPTDLTANVIYSDQWGAYCKIEDVHEGNFYYYQHMTVNHSVCFKDPTTLVHTNTCEGAWRSQYKSQIPSQAYNKCALQGHLFERVWKRKYMDDLWNSLWRVLEETRFERDDSAPTKRLIADTL